MGSSPAEFVRVAGRGGAEASDASETVERRGGEDAFIGCEALCVGDCELRSVDPSPSRLVSGMTERSWARCVESNSFAGSPGEVT